jgi:hypothetical protein
MGRTASRTERVSALRGCVDDAAPAALARRLPARPTAQQQHAQRQRGVAAALARASMSAVI